MIIEYITQLFCGRHIYTLVVTFIFSSEAKSLEISSLFTSLRKISSTVTKNYRTFNHGEQKTYLRMQL